MLIIIIVVLVMMIVFLGFFYVSMLKRLELILNLEKKLICTTDNINNDFISVGLIHEHKQKEITLEKEAMNRIQKY